MISLFGRSPVPDARVLRIPHYCVPCEEAESLRPKRELQLEWMREKGVRYLGNPADRVPRKDAAAPSARVVSIRRTG